LKEGNFGRREYGEPLSLFVALLHPGARTTAKADPQNRLVLEMICQIQER